jgi:hypothetical protein
MKTTIAAQAERIAKLEAYILTITSIPGVVDIEKRIDAVGFANPIKDAREALKG